MVRVGSGTPRRAVPAGASPRLKPLVVAIGLALGAGAGTPAMATVFTVTNVLDSGGGSLRQAVIDANTTPGADVINFVGAGATGTIALLVTPINVTDPLTINGPGASLLTITSPAAAPALVNISNVAISGVTFAGGSTGPFAVGSIGVGSSLTLQSCVFSNNSGLAGTVVYNDGGAVFISDCTFNNNTAGAAGAVLSALGTLNITNSTFSGNQGAAAGAIFSSHDTFVMTNSTISGNTGIGVGGIYLAEMAAPAAIRNSTLSGNVAISGPAGAIFVGTTLSAASNVLNLTSTIAANSTSNPGTIDIARSGTATINATNSLIENGAGAINGTNTAPIFGGPLLGPLQNNGGPTKTHALLPVSPAIDTGSNPLMLTTDQRGAGFARTVGSATDIGAYEVQAPASAATAIPTLSEWGTVALAALLGGVTLLTGLGRRRRDG